LSLFFPVAGNYFCERLKTAGINVSAHSVPTLLFAREVTTAGIQMQFSAPANGKYCFLTKSASRHKTAAGDGVDRRWAAAKAQNNNNKREREANTMCADDKSGRLSFSVSPFPPRVALSCFSFNLFHFVRKVKEKMSKKIHRSSNKNKVQGDIFLFLCQQRIYF